jgi:hypothetical protein
VLCSTSILDWGIGGISLHDFPRRANILPSLESPYRVSSVAEICTTILVGIFSLVARFNRTASRSILDRFAMAFGLSVPLGLRQAEPRVCHHEPRHFFIAVERLLGHSPAFALIGSKLF